MQEKASEWRKLRRIKSRKKVPVLSFGEYNGAKSHRRKINNWQWQKEEKSEDEENQWEKPSRRVFFAGVRSKRFSIFFVIHIRNAYIADAVLFETSKWFASMLIFRLVLPVSGNAVKSKPGDGCRFPVISDSLTQLAQVSMKHHRASSHCCAIQMAHGWSRVDGWVFHWREMFSMVRSVSVWFFDLLIFQDFSLLCVELFWRIGGFSRKSFVDCVTCFLSNELIFKSGTSKHRTKFANEVVKLRSSI